MPKDKKPEDLKPLMIFRNTWWQSLNDGYVILLSAEHTGSNIIPEYLKRGKDEYLWTIAFSYKGMGCSIRQWYSEEILKCKFLGYLPQIIDAGYIRKDKIELDEGKIRAILTSPNNDLLWKSEKQMKDIAHAIATNPEVIK